MRPYLLVTLPGIEPGIPPWKGGVLTAWPQGQYFLVAGEGFEPPAFGLWARRATRLLHPASIVSPTTSFFWCRESESNRYGVLPPQDFKSCASASSATPAYNLALRVGLEPTAYRLTAGCSTIELPKIIFWFSTNLAITYSPRSSPTKYHQRIDA
jgi:hypothetical protein